MERQGLRPLRQRKGALLMLATVPGCTIWEASSDALSVLDVNMWPPRKFRHDEIDQFLTLCGLFVFIEYASDASLTGAVNRCVKVTRKGQSPKTRSAGKPHSQMGPARISKCSVCRGRVLPSARERSYVAQARL